MKFAVTLVLFLLLRLSAGAQDSLFTATKTIERIFPYRAGKTTVNIEGQKAEVFIDTWQREEVSVEVILESRHADAETARSGLDLIAYQAETVQQKVYLRNYSRQSAEAPAEAPVLGARYVIRLPKDCPVYVKNHFGQAQINDLDSELQINSEFTQIGLENIRGRIDVITRFGDLEANFIDGNMTVDARRSNILLNEIRGTYDIKAQYGSIRVFSDPNLIRLNIDALRSDVFLYSAQPEIFAYDIKALNANVNTPDWMQFKSLQDIPEGMHQQFTPQNEIYANITVMINFGDLIVEKLIKGGKGK